MSLQLKYINGLDVGHYDGDADRRPRIALDGLPAKLDRPDVAALIVVLQDWMRSHRPDPEAP